MLIVLAVAVSASGTAPSLVSTAQAALPARVVRWSTAHDFVAGADSGGGVMTSPPELYGTPKVE